VISESQRKGTAVLGDGEIFAGLLPEVVATGAAICDKALTRRWKCVAFLAKIGGNIHFFNKNVASFTFFSYLCKT
jgi:hypothetical protein